MTEQSGLTLAFDCSGGSCSAAVGGSGGVLAERFELMQRGQAEALLPMIEAVMAEAGIAFSRLTRIITTTGPGSFTGLRIGISAARGLSLASGIPAFGITSFEAVYLGLERSERRAGVAVVIDSRRGSLFCQATAPDGSPLSEPVGLEPAHFLDWLPPHLHHIAGDGVALLKGIALPPHVAVSLAPEVIKAAALLCVPTSAGIHPPQPLYLRPPDVTQPKPRAISQTQISGEADR